MKKSSTVTTFVLMVFLFVLVIYAINKAQNPQVTMNTPATYGMFYGAASTTMLPPPNIPGMVYVEGDKALNIESFYIGQYEVTQKEWIDVMGSNPANSPFKGDTLPVESMSWNTAITYCNKRSLKEGLTPVYYDHGIIADEIDFRNNDITMDPKANGYRLPTNAEWEYAANGGNNYENYTYSGSDNIDSVAWHSGNSNKTTHPVGSKMPNALGIYDMSGNVMEWCWDWYEEGSISGGGSSGRITRGGSWFLHAIYHPWSSADSDALWTLYAEYPHNFFEDTGLRVVRGL